MTQRYYGMGSQKDSRRNNNINEKTSNKNLRTRGQSVDVEW